MSRSALLLLIAILVSGGLDAQQTFRGVSSQASAGMGEIELAGCTVDLRVPFSPSAAHPFFPVMVRFANKGANTRTVTFTIESGDQWGSIGREVIPYRVRRELTLSPGAEQLQWVPMPTPAVGRYFGNYQLNARLTVEGEILPRESRIWLDIRTVGDSSNVARARSVRRGSTASISVPAPAVLIVKGKEMETSILLDSGFDQLLQFRSQTGPLRWDRSKTQRQEVSPLEMPLESATLARVDHLLLVGVSPDDLNPAQRKAVRRAVREGMIAWIIPDESGTGNRWVLDEAQASSAPRVVGGEEEERIYFLPQTDRGIPLGGDTVESPPEMVLYSDGLGEWRRFTSVDPIQIPVELQSRPSTLWARVVPAMLVADSPDFSLYGTNQYGTGAMLAVQAIDRGLRRMIGPRTVLSFTAIYLLVIGPGLFFFLKRIRRGVWQLWLQPLVVVAFLLATWILGASNYGLVSRDHDTIFVYQKAGETEALVVRIHSHYSPIGGLYEMPTGGGPVLPIKLGGGKTRIEKSEDLPPVRKVRTWSLAHSLTYEVVDLGGTAHVERMTQGWRYRNNLPYPLLDTVGDFITSERSTVVGVGDISAGATMEWAGPPRPSSARDSRRALGVAVEEPVRFNLFWRKSSGLPAEIQLVGMIPEEELKRTVGREATSDWSLDGGERAFHIVLTDLEQ